MSIVYEAEKSIKENGSDLVYKLTKTETIGDEVKITYRFVVMSDIDALILEIQNKIAQFDAQWQLELDDANNQKTAIEILK